METLALAQAPKQFADKYPSLIPLLEFDTHFSSVIFSSPTCGGLLLEDILRSDETRENSDISFPDDNKSARCVTSTSNLDAKRPMLGYDTHFSSVNFSSPTCGGLPLQDILRSDDTEENSHVLFPYGNNSAVCVTGTSNLDTMRPRISSRPSRIRVASFVSTSPPISTWFDDSSTRSVFTIGDDNISTSSWGNKNQWLDEDLAYMYLDHEGDKRSIVSFGPPEMTSSPTSESYDSHTMVPTEDGGTSTSSDSKHPIFDCLDEQLLSPMDSFAAMCWDAAITPERSRLKVKNKAPEWRYSKLYSDAARKYEAAQTRESSDLAGVTLPPMKFGEVVRVSKTAPPEVAPWLYVSKKATSMLGLSGDSSATLKSDQPSIMPSRAVHQRHRRGKSTLGSIKLPFNLGLHGKYKK